MTLDDFIAKWSDKPIDFDRIYGYQCMDLMHQYIYDVLGLTDARILAAPTAKDVFLSYPSIYGSQYFTKIDNTPDNVPQPGDIIFWGTTIGSAGHVAIFISGDVNAFNSFDQNWPVNSFCHIQGHNYNGVLGWLHPVNVQPDVQSILNTCIHDRDSHWNDLISIWNKLGLTGDISISLILGELDKLISYEDQLRKKDADLQAQEQKVLEIQGKALDLEKQVSDLQNQNNESKTLIDSLQKEIGLLKDSTMGKDAIIGKLNEQIAELKRTTPINSFSGMSLIIIGIKRLLGRG